MVDPRFSDRARAIEWAARRVMFLAKWLIEAVWPIPLEDVERVVHDLEEVIRSCAPPHLHVEDAGAETFGSAAQDSSALHDDGDRGELRRRTALLVTFGATFASVHQTDKASVDDLKKLGVLAAAVMDAVSKELAARARIARSAS